jgi:hypothetical protein
MLRSHDNFDAVRGGPADFYMTYSARAGRPLPGSDPARDVERAGRHGRQDGSPLQDSPGARVYTDAVYPHQADLRGHTVDLPPSIRQVMAQRRKQQKSRQVNAVAGQTGQTYYGSSSQRQDGHPPHDQDRHLLSEKTAQQRSKAAREQARKSSGQNREQRSGDEYPCPPVVLLGIDATPSWGLRPPTNFLGRGLQGAS